MASSPSIRLPGSGTSCGCRSHKSGRPSLMIRIIRICLLKLRTIRPGRSSSFQKAFASGILSRKRSENLLHLGCCFRCLGSSRDWKFARRNAARNVNSIMTATYWKIGRRIVEHEQGGVQRAKYGTELMERLSADLIRRFYEAEALRGGWTVRQLDRQIQSQFYERTALSRNKTAILKKGKTSLPGDIVTADEEIKNPL